MISALFSAFLFVAHGQQNPSGSLRASLRTFCPDDDSGWTFNRWSNVDSGKWYWENDWQVFERNQQDPFDEDCDVANGDVCEVYPAGFRKYTLGWYNDPAICMWVPGSHDKKVEILIESDTKNANLCLHDISDKSVDLNNVGAVSNCGAGKLYACFTAATPDDDGDGNDATENFGFYVYCNGSGCEQSDMTIRMRIRVSDRSWDEGKEGQDTDLEHWCEYERGTTFEDMDVEDGGHLYYTYPSDLVPDEPSSYPFHIQHLFYGSDASSSHPNWLALLTAMGIATLIWA